MGTEPYINFRFVREHADLEAVIAHYGIKALGRGKQRKARCPFHEDRRPSLSLDLEKRVFHCFGCGAKGNALELVADLEQLDRKTGLREAAVKLAAICSIPLAPEDAGDGLSRPQEARRHGATMKEAPSPAPRAAPGAPRGPQGDANDVNPPLTFALKLDRGHPYLAERGLSPAIAEEFDLGYANRGIMKGRLCIPIHDAQGRLVAYAGRWVGSEETIPEGEDKYKLPPGFQKTRVLYNLHRLIEDGGKNENLQHLFLVEGYFSAFRLHEKGASTVALMGSTISDEQIALIAEHFPAVGHLTLLLDGDEAGRKAREAILPRLCSRYFVRAPELPEGASPDNLPDEHLFELIDEALI